jgi:CRP-like cAMP-binding protein
MACSENGTLRDEFGAPPPAHNRKALEDLLQQLPCSIIQVFGRGETIYRQDQRSANFYLLIDGKVELYRTVGTGSRSVVVDIYRQGEFFGESTFSVLRYPETAVALQDTRVMVWTVDEINRLIPDRPKLAIALIQFIVQRSRDFERRIESMAIESISTRLARALIRFSERFGTRGDDGSVHMVPFRHELLGQYVGTSREIISEYMNRLRERGCIRYSRHDISLDVEALNCWLNQNQSSHAGKSAAARVANVRRSFEVTSE